MRDEFWLEEQPQGEFEAFGDYMRGERGPEGPMGPAGKSAYQQAVDGGYTGTEEEFNEQLAAYTELTDDVDKLQSAVNSQLSVLDFTPELRPNGYFSVADGSAKSSSTGKYARTTNLFSGSPEIVAVAFDTAVYEYAITYYDSTGATDGTGYLNYLPYQAGSTRYIPNNAVLIGLSFRRVNQAAMTTSDIEAIAQALSFFSPTDETLTQPRKAADAKVTGDGLSALSSTKAPAIYNTASGVVASFDDGAEDMPLKGLTVNIEPVQSGSGDPSPENVRPITGWTGCKLHRTGVSLIGGDAFIGNTFSKTASGYKLSYNDSSIGNRASASADIRGLPAGRYTIVMLNPSYPEGAAVNIRRSTAGSTVTMGNIIGSAAYGRRTYNIPENTTSLQLYILPGTIPLNTSITMSDIVLVREADDDFPEPYNGNVYSITFPSEAGTVYGGTLDVTQGKMVVDRAYLQKRIGDMDNTDAAPGWKSSGVKDIIGAGFNAQIVGAICSAFSSQFIRANTNGVNDILFFPASGIGKTQTELIAAMPDLTVDFVIPLATPFEITLTPTQIETLLGQNNIWSDAGTVDVDYCADTKLYIDNIHKPTEDDMTADAQIASGKYFLIGGNLYKSTTVIPAGDTIIPGTNCITTNLAEALNALNA